MVVNCAGPEKRLAKPQTGLAHGKFLQGTVTVNDSEVHIYINLCSCKSSFRFLGLCKRQASLGGMVVFREYAS